MVSTRLSTRAKFLFVVAVAGIATTSLAVLLLFSNHAQTRIDLDSLKGELSRTQQEQDRAIANLEAQLDRLTRSVASQNSLALREHDSDDSAQHTATTGGLSKQVNALQAQVDGLNRILQNVLEENNALQAQLKKNSDLEMLRAVMAQANPDAPQGDLPRWGIEQALGPPDTANLGDHFTAWAPLEPNKGLEWIEVDFDNDAEGKGVVPQAVLIRQTFNPGAITSVEAIAPSGRRTLLQSTGQSTSSEVDLQIPYSGSLPIRTIRIEFDTTRVSGWNEIDAVGLVDGDETIWASSGSASSTYADRQVSSLRTLELELQVGQ